MTQEEIDIVYNYLHENYEYRDGELFLLKNKTFYKKGHKVGVVASSEKGKGYAHLMTAFYIQGRSYSMPLSHAIYIFHNKKKPEFITFLDKNRMNCRIENLRSCSWSDIQFDQIENNQGYKIQGNKYRVCIRATDYGGTIGVFDTQEIAKEIYLLARKTLKEEPQTIEELRDNLSRIHPLVKKKSKPKRILPHAFITKNGKFDSKFNFKKKYIYLGAFDTPLEAHYAAISFKEKYKKNPDIIFEYVNKIKNKTGLKGVYIKNGKIFAQIQVNGEKKLLGPFDSEEEASKKYLEAKDGKLIKEYNSNQIITINCLDCKKEIKNKLRYIHLMKYCNTCKSEHIKFNDRNRKKPKARARTIVRDFKQYIIGYFHDSNESDEAYDKAAKLYDEDIEQFYLKFKKFRKIIPKTKEENQKAYAKHRNKIGLLTRQQLKND